MPVKGSAKANGEDHFVGGVGLAGQRAGPGDIAAAVIQVWVWDELEGDGAGT